VDGSLDVMLCEHQQLGLQDWPHKCSPPATAHTQLHLAQQILLPHRRSGSMITMPPQWYPSVQVRLAAAAAAEVRARAATTRLDAVNSQVKSSQVNQRPCFRRTSS
jgi:hypothetical protein